MSSPDRGVGFQPASVPQSLAGWKPTPRLSSERLLADEAFVERLAFGTAFVLVDQLHVIDTQRSQHVGMQVVDV